MSNNSIFYSCKLGNRETSFYIAIILSLLMFVEYKNANLTRIVILFPLQFNTNFIPLFIQVTHVWPNETLRKKDEHKEYSELQGCFYKGHVRGDDKSLVSVSLCGGMVSAKRFIDFPNVQP